jgi:broad specificity polyphosphatase/5'/3'-nucleotidase SurE
MTATIQHVINTSGTVAIASTSTSIGVSKIAASAPPNAETLISHANEWVTVADMIGMFSALVLFSSFLWNIYVTRKRKAIDEKFYQLRKQELQLERDKFKHEQDKEAA